MKHVKIGMATLVLAVVVLAGAISMRPAVGADTAVPTTPAEHAAEATKYEQEARDLQAKADRHADLGRGYKARASAGSKQSAALQSLASHCVDLEKAYRTAAKAAEEMAKSHRELAGGA